MPTRINNALKAIRQTRI